MAVTLNGVVHGKHIDLDAEPLVPDGAAVIVRIERKPLTKDEKRRLLAATAGAWAADPSLAAVFAEIEQRRRDALPREATDLG
jgi:hypothetical protein